MRIGQAIRATAVASLVSAGFFVLSSLEEARALEVEAGRALLDANCASCHAIGDTGASPVANAPAFRTLSERYPVESLEEALAEGIFVGHEGSPQMPELSFESDEIGAIVAYLRSIQPK
ncbi:MAG: cytochrome c [Salinarimonadaceae bacterium]|nr:MAG: cytochrome c [Salinarimonadaceae bacterium]